MDLKATLITSWILWIPCFPAIFCAHVQETKEENTKLCSGQDSGKGLTTIPNGRWWLLACHRHKPPAPALA